MLLYCYIIFRWLFATFIFLGLHNCIGNPFLYPFALSYQYLDIIGFIQDSFAVEEKKIHEGLKCSYQCLKSFKSKDSFDVC